jgi:hypothetical protein
MENENLLPFPTSESTYISSVGPNNPTMHFDNTKPNPIP